MDNKLKAATSIALIACVSIPLMSPSQAPSPHPTNNFPPQDVLDAHYEVSERLFSDRMELDATRYEKFRSGYVIEKGSAGFHVLEPEAPLMNGDVFERGHRGGSKKHDYYPVTKHECRPTDNTVMCQWSAAFSNNAISSAQVTTDRDDSTRFAVEVTFDSRGITILARMMETTPGVIFVPDYSLDWAANVRYPGDPLTDMNMVLISEGVAYRPWSVSTTVAGNQPNTPIVVAGNLDATTAAELVARLGF